MKLDNIQKFLKDGDTIKEEYDIKKLNPRKNPFAKNAKKPITMNVSVDTL